MSLPDSIAGPWHVLIPINISESHHPLITNFEVFISFTNCYFFFILANEKGIPKFFEEIQRKERVERVFDKNEDGWDVFLFASLCLCFFTFFSSFFFSFPKKKSNRPALLRRPNELVVHEIGAPHPFHRFGKILVLSGAWTVLYNTRDHECQWMGIKKGDQCAKR